MEPFIPVPPFRDVDVFKFLSLTAELETQGLDKGPDSFLCFRQLLRQAFVPVGKGTEEIR